MADSTGHRRRVKIKRPQFLQEMPARFMKGANVSVSFQIIQSNIKLNYIIQCHGLPS